MLEEYWAMNIIREQDLGYHCFACLPPLRLSRNKGVLEPGARLVLSTSRSGEQQPEGGTCSRNPPAQSDCPMVASY